MSKEDKMVPKKVWKRIQKIDSLGGENPIIGTLLCDLGNAPLRHRITSEQMNKGLIDQQSSILYFNTRVSTKRWIEKYQKG